MLLDPKVWIYVVTAIIIVLISIFEEDIVEFLLDKMFENNPILGIIFVAFILILAVVIWLCNKIKYYKSLKQYKHYKDPKYNVKYFLLRDKELKLLIVILLMFVMLFIALWNFISIKV